MFGSLLAYFSVMKLKIIMRKRNENVFVPHYGTKIRRAPLIQAVGLIKNDSASMSSLRLCNLVCLANKNCYQGQRFHFTLI